MPGIGTINLKVLILDTDYYAVQAINSYLAWDRRTRVTGLVTDTEMLWDHLRLTAPAEMPDVLLFDADNMGGADTLRAFFQRLRRFVPTIMVICMVQRIEPDLVDIAAEMGASAFLLKHEVQLQITWAICKALDVDFLVTANIYRQTRNSTQPRVHDATILPERRDYPEMGERTRQAIKLCVIEGMPAHLAADEMGISLHTIRGYIKDGYRILESHDHYEYPTDMTPQERAFMRFTALAEGKS
ncbi:MAG: hypothetical protein ACPG7F_08315 [Aggregatilineales bacterium]